MPGTTREVVEMHATSNAIEFRSSNAAESSSLTRFAGGQIQSAGDVVALRRHVGLTQKQFAGAMGISVHTLRNWEQGRRSPDGPALALLRIAARHPRIIRENVEEESTQKSSPVNTLEAASPDSDNGTGALPFRR